jgi:hypothetical protein
MPAPMTRRQMLRQCAGGFGAVALAGLAARSAGGATEPFGPRLPHHRPRARRVIFLYMDGGVSQVDSFDPKPRLKVEHGQPFRMKMEPTQFDDNGNTLGSPWEFRRYGQSGLPISDLFPHTARHADDLCVIRSMVSSFSEHTNANYFLHTGSGLQGRPSMGAWFCYGLGSENRDLPGFVVLNGGLIPPGGLDNFNSGFLPATYQGSIFRPADQPVANIQRTESSAAVQESKLRLMRRLDAASMAAAGASDPVESAIANYELAFRMQAAVPELMELKGESEATRRLYGLDSAYKPTAIFAAQCLIARRLAERGVRFIELTCPKVSGDRWDQHKNLREGHQNNALAVDQPIGALLTDLKARGMLDETLVVWAGEFGRTPFAQGADGRDHNPFAFSIWMAGGGVRGGTLHGQTDDYGYKVVKDKVVMHDLHANMLHLRGVDHEHSTYRFGGRDMRLTAVHGRIIPEILA